MTIKDIARECGYSVSTVSRVINGHLDVKQETKEHILRVVKTHNFVPNSNARNLKSQDTENILIIVCGMSNMLFAKMVESIQKEVNFYHSYSVVEYLSEDANVIEETYSLLKNIKPKGIIFLGGNIHQMTEELKNFELPCMFITSSTEHINKENIMSISIDDFNAGKYATNYLLSLNHKKIGVISGAFCSSSASKMRYEGWKEALYNSNIEYDENNIVFSKFSYQAAYNATKELLFKFSDLTAIFAMSDVMAIGAISAITDSGLKVPEDISVIGIDGIDLARFYNPKITTLKQPQEEMCKMAVRRLMESINYEPRAYNKMLEAELMLGNSVKQL